MNKFCAEYIKNNPTCLRSALTFKPEIVCWDNRLYNKALEEYQFRKITYTELQEKLSEALKGKDIE